MMAQISDMFNAPLYSVIGKPHTSLLAPYKKVGVFTLIESALVVQVEMEEMEGKERDEEKLQDSLVVEEVMMVNFLLVPFPLVS